jgi:DNA-binding transcriptional regulator PaaX
LNIIFFVLKISETTKYVLEAFIPYTEANLLLSFKPSLFFNELEKKTGYKKRSLESAYYRSVKKGLIKLDENHIPHLTKVGRRKTKLYKPTKLKIGVHLMVIFDIPENERKKRDRLRTLLRELSFQKIQQSVWETRYDHREHLRAEIEDMNLQQYVRVYEAASIEI